MFDLSLCPELPEAKQLVTIPLVWKRLGYPDHSSLTSVCSPFRTDNRPSFSVFTGTDGASRFKDHATGDGGDVIDFFSTALKVDVACAIRLTRAMAKAIQDGESCEGVVGTPTAKVASAHIEKPRLELTGLHDLTDAAFDALATQRGFRTDKGLRIAANRGMLFGAVDLSREVQWIMTDAERRHASRRNFSGLPFADSQKAMALKGSTAGWPIGLADAQNRKRIILCEGGPDTLSAFTLLAMFGASDTTPVDTDEYGIVMMGGASCTICPDALPLFKGKAVTLVPHHDVAGLRGATKWSEQLKAAGADVTVLDLAPFIAAGGKDLNDALRHDADAVGTQLFRS